MGSIGPQFVSAAAQADKELERKKKEQAARPDGFDPAIYASVPDEYKTKPVAEVVPEVTLGGSRPVGGKDQTPEPVQVLGTQRTKAGARKGSQSRQISRRRLSTSGGLNFGGGSILTVQNPTTGSTILGS